MIYHFLNVTKINAIPLNLVVFLFIIFKCVEASILKNMPDLAKILNLESAPSDWNIQLSFHINFLNHCSKSHHQSKGEAQCVSG